ncbi:threonine/serine exporter family protein [Galactobacter sp.]|uniref:threonine/serine exporter family protein n=1 Tax=Galactobacter sp. TaxID=2676125 RepID=UPI0025BDBFB9|nr:threonine/serine exporter family protein [Galactobacter sp.]
MSKRQGQQPGKRPRRQEGSKEQAARTPENLPTWDHHPLPAVPPSQAGAGNRAGEATSTPKPSQRSTGGSHALPLDVTAEDPRTDSMPLRSTITSRVSLLRQIAAAPVPDADTGQPNQAGLDRPDVAPIDGYRTGYPTTGSSSAPDTGPGTPSQPVASSTAQDSGQGSSPDTRAVPIAPTRGNDQYQLRVSGATTAVPQVAHPGARNVLRRILEGEAPATVSFNIVDRLVGSPYASSKRTEREAQAEEARPILVLALDLAESMLRWGAGALDVETSIIAVTTSLGLRHVDVDITNQSVHLNWTREDAFPVSVLRVVRSISDNYAGLSLVHQLVGDISAGRTNYDEAKKRLRQIRRRRLPYNEIVEFAMGALFAGLFVILIGGKLPSALACVVTTTMAAAIVKLGKKYKVPNFYAVALATFVVTLISLVLYSWEWIHQPSTVVAGGIMLLLPSGRFVSAVQDAINGFPVTAVSRLFSATLVFGAIITGVMLGAIVGVAFNLSQLDPTQTLPQPDLALWVLTLLAVGAVVAGGITQQVAGRHLGALAVVALAGYLIHWSAANLWGAGDRLAPAIAAVVMGLLARFIGLRIGAPALVLSVPSIVILLPGLTIFRSMYAMAVSSTDINASLGGIITALMVVLSIAAGVALGDTLARPLTRDWNSRVRRRLRER